MIISAFPGTGKTYFVNNNQDAFDSDSSHFSWVVDEQGVKSRNPEFPRNYVEHIKDLDSQGKLVFVSSHKEVREALREAKLHYKVIVPHWGEDCKKEYLRRYKERGSDQAFITLLEQNWGPWIVDIVTNDPNNIVIGSHETITTLIGKMGRPDGV